MRTGSFGTLTYKSFAYFVLRSLTMLIGSALSVLVRLALPPAEASPGDGFWSDFAHGSLMSLSAAPVLLAAAFGGRLIRRFWIVVPQDRDAERVDS